MPIPIEDSEAILKEIRTRMQGARLEWIDLIATTAAVEGPLDHQLENYLDAAAQLIAGQGCVGITRDMRLLSQFLKVDGEMQPIAISLTEAEQAVFDSPTYILEEDPALSVLAMEFAAVRNAIVNADESGRRE